VRPIVIGYDDSLPSQAAMRWAAREAALRHAWVLVVHAVSPAFEWTLAALQINTDRHRSDLARQLRGPWTNVLRARDVPYGARVVTGRPGAVLLDLARANDAACIVIGASRERRFAHWSDGPVGRFVLHHARRPVISVPAEVSIAGRDDHGHELEVTAGEESDDASDGGRARRPEQSAPHQAA